jgi:hypothetical protein
MNFDFRLYEGCHECLLLNCWSQCLAVRYLDRASLQAVTMEAAQPPVFSTEPSTWNRVSSVFWRAETLTSYCAAGIRFWARVLFLYLLKDCFLIRAAASPAVTVSHYPCMNETSRMRADDGGRPVVSWNRERVSLGPFMILFRLYAAWGPSCSSPRCCLNFLCPLF